MITKIVNGKRVSLSNEEIYDIFNLSDVISITNYFFREIGFSLYNLIPSTEDQKLPIEIRHNDELDIYIHIDPNNRTIKFYHGESNVGILITYIEKYDSAKSNVYIVDIIGSKTIEETFNYILTTIRTLWEGRNK
jgi:hypothetical protein